MDLEMWQGDALKFYVALSDKDGTPVDLSQLTVAAEMRTNFSSTTVYAFNCSVIDAANGKAQVYMSSATSRTIPPGSYVWSLQMTDAAGDVHTYLAGDATVYAEVPIA